MQAYEEVESGNLCLLPAHQKFLLCMIDAKHQHSPVHTLEASGPGDSPDSCREASRTGCFSEVIWGSVSWLLVGGAIMQKTE